MTETEPTVQHTTIEYNGGIFTSISYNGIECLFTERYHAKFYNLSKVLKENGKAMDLNKITRNKYWQDYLLAVIDEFDFDEENERFIGKVQTPKKSSADLLLQKLKFTIKGNQYQEEVNGVYYHEIFMNFFCEHVSLKYAVKVSKIMNLVNEELHLRNITLEEKIKEMEEEHEKYRKNINSGFNHERKGCLLIKQTKADANHYHINFDEKEHLHDKNYIVLNGIFNPQKVHSLLNFYAKESQLPNIKWVKPRVIETDDISNIYAAVAKIQNFEVKPPDYDDVIDKLKSSFKVKNEKLKAKMFEIFCSIKFEIPLYKHDKTEAFGLTKIDKGIDLFDIKNGVFGQCKYYSSIRLTRSKIETFIRFCETLDTFDAFLYVNAKCQITKDVQNCQLFKIVRVDDKEFDDFYDEQTEDLQSDSLKIENVKATTVENETRYSKYKKTKTTNDSILMAENWLKEQLETNDFIYFDDALQYVRDNFGINVNSDRRFGILFSHLYLHVRKNMLPQDENGRRLLKKNIDKNDEIEFIKSYFGFGQYMLEDYLPVHNERFKTSYDERSFGMKFRSLFKRIRRTINDIPEVFLYEIQDNEEKNDAFLDFFEQNGDVLSREDLQRFPKAQRDEKYVEQKELLEAFNETFHRFDKTHDFRVLFQALIR